MLIACLAGAIVFFAALCAFLAFDNRMLKDDKAFLLRRAKRAEGDAARAIAARTHAERDAVALAAQAVEVGERAKRLSAHVLRLMRERSQQQSLQLEAPRRFEFSKSPDQNAATRSAHLN